MAYKRTGRPQVIFRAPVEMLKGTDQLAALTERTRSEVIREAIAEHLAKHGIAAA